MSGLKENPSSGYAHLGKAAKCQAKGAAYLADLGEGDEPEITMASQFLQNRRNVSRVTHCPTVSLPMEKTLPALAQFGIHPKVS
jgi:hypothetical protein